MRLRDSSDSGSLLAILTIRSYGSFNMLGSLLALLFGNPHMHPLGPLRDRSGKLHLCSQGIDLATFGKLSTNQALQPYHPHLSACSLVEFTRALAREKKCSLK